MSFRKFQEKKLVSFLLFFNILLFLTSYLPSFGVLELGERSWPLSFALLDVFSLFLIVWVVVQFLRAKKKSRQWLFVLVLLIFPLLNLYATVHDLYRPLCRDPKCAAYVGPPDWGRVRIHFE